jgi:hypothetical protein
MSTTEVVMPRTRCRNAEEVCMTFCCTRLGHPHHGAASAGAGPAHRQRWDKCKPLVRLARSTA